MICVWVFDMSNYDMCVGVTVCRYMRCLVICTLVFAMSNYDIFSSYGMYGKLILGCDWWKTVNTGVKSPIL